MQKSLFRKVRKAVFPVAGLGTRFLPATKVMPKEMLIVGDKPLIQHAVEEAAAAGIEEFIFITSKGKILLEEHFREHAELMRILSLRGKTELLDALRRSTLPAEKLTIRYQDQPLGLGHAVWCAREFIGDEPFAVLLPDDYILAETPCLTQMTSLYDATGGNLVSVMEVPRADTKKYGVLDIAHDDGRVAEICGLVEKPEPDKAPSTLSIVGRYILQPEIFELLAKVQKGSGGEIQLTDAMAGLIGKQPFHGYRFDGKRFDCGSQFGLVEAMLEYALASESTALQARSLLKAKAAALENDRPAFTRQRQRAV